MNDVALALNFILSQSTPENLHFWYCYGTPLGIMFQESRFQISNTNYSTALNAFSMNMVGLILVEFVKDCSISRSVKGSKNFRLSSEFPGPSFPGQAGLSSLTDLPGL